MTEAERRYVEECLADAEARNRFGSNACKPYRERLTCAMLLRALGVPFAVEELISVPDGPPHHVDVMFRDARFQVREVLDRERRRHDEPKRRIQQLRAAKTIEDSELDYSSDYIPMCYSEVFTHLTEALAEKASKYGTHVCAELDALVLIQRWRYLDTSSPLSGYEALLQQGWRSVSFVMRSSGHVIYGKASAPAFLQEYAGHTKQWNGTGPFYDL
jgi:Putative endonuclease, protein of unknown function (DUF1780)